MKNVKILSLSLIALALVGCARDSSGTYTGTQTVSSSLGGSSQKNITLQLTDSAGDITASIISDDGSSGQLSARREGESLSSVTYTYNQSMNLMSGGQAGATNPGVTCTGASTLTGVGTIGQNDSLSLNLQGPCSNGATIGFGNNTITIQLQANKQVQQ